MDEYARWLGRMTMDELLSEHKSAQEARIRAEYIDDMSAWNACVQNAIMRVHRVNAEIERRKQNG